MVVGLRFGGNDAKKLLGFLTEADLVGRRISDLLRQVAAGAPHDRAGVRCLQPDDFRLGSVARSALTFHFVLA